ncbi:MAG: ABC transporter permease [Candidatus Solibacter usitatus]|nr:ABC transporter permease [Candidatus Solibacter usitatus]
MRTLREDVRYALRGLRRSPGFTAVAVIALALGIGANTAIFSVVNAVLLRPLPYRDAGRLVVVDERHLTGPEVGNVSPANFLDWREQNRVFDPISAAFSWGVNLTGRGEAEQIAGLQVTSNLFTLLGAQAKLGRTFLPEEGQPGAKRVVVLSHALWQRRFGSDPNIVGQAVTLSGESRTIVGVMPAGFGFPPYWATRAELWAPMQFDARFASMRGGRMLRVFGRLKPGVSIKQAQAEMDLITERLRRQYPGEDAEMGALVQPLHEKVVGSIRPALLVLLGAVGCVLLIACANVANLLLARATGRQKEMAIRTAIGAGSGRIVRQLLTESMVLSLAGGAMGLLVAAWGVQALIAALSRTLTQGAGIIPRFQEIGIDLSVLGFTLALTLVTGIVFGLAPALQSTNLDLNGLLKDSAGPARGEIKFGGRRSRAMLVVAEVALAEVLLIGAGLLLHSFWRLQQVDPGFRAEHVLAAEVSVAGSGFVERQLPFYTQLLQKLEAVPGVVSVGAINHLPLAGDIWTFDFTVEGQPAPPPGQEPSAAYRIISPRYFETMGTPLLRGRGFDGHDVEGAPMVAIISDAMARRNWPNQDPIGKRFRMGRADSTNPWLTVAGVARNVKQSEWAAEPGPELYLPYLQHPEYFSGRSSSYMTFVVRTSGDPAALSSAFRHEVAAFDRNLPVSNMATLEAVVSDAQWRPRFNMLLLSIFAATALALAVVGIFGVISYAVAQRTREIGIRMALGAKPGDVLALVVKQGLGLALAGVAIGLGAAAIVTRAMATMLYGISATDPMAFAGVSAVLIAAALAATYLPARRAAKVDPMVSLRTT